jgi:hypothetical protein
MVFEKTAMGSQMQSFAKGSPVVENFSRFLSSPFFLLQGNALEG